jgi:hypothetical protein
MSDGSLLDDTRPVDSLQGRLDRLCAELGEIELDIVRLEARSERGAGATWCDARALQEAQRFIDEMASVARDDANALVRSAEAAAAEVLATARAHAEVLGATAGSSGVTDPRSAATEVEAPNQTPNAATEVEAPNEVLDDVLEDPGDRWDALEPLAGSEEAEDAAFAALWKEPTPTPSAAWRSGAEVLLTMLVGLGVLIVLLVWVG